MISSSILVAVPPFILVEPVTASGYRNTLVSLRLQEYISVIALAKHSACNLIDNIAFTVNRYLAKKIFFYYNMSMNKKKF